MSNSEFKPGKQTIVHLSVHETLRLVNWRTWEIVALRLGSFNTLAELNGAIEVQKNRLARSGILFKDKVVSLESVEQH